MLVLQWIAFAVLIALVVTGLILQRRLRPRLDTTIRVGGYTVAQVKAIRRDVFAGRLPADDSLHEVALVTAAQAAQNIPTQLRYLPLIYTGFALGFIFIGLGTSAYALVFLILGVVFAGMDVYLVIAGLRALRNSRKLLAGNTTGASGTE